MAFITASRMAIGGTDQISRRRTLPIKTSYGEERGFRATGCLSSSPQGWTQRCWTSVVRFLKRRSDKDDNDRVIAAVHHDSNFASYLGVNVVSTPKRL